MGTQILKIQFRQGNKTDLVLEKLIPGEPVIALDSDDIGVKSGGGRTAWIETLDADGKLKHMPAPADIGALSKVKILNSSHTSNVVETQTVDLGFRPKYVRIRAEFGISNGAVYDSDGVSDGASQCCFFKFGNGISAPDINAYNIVAIHSGSGGNYAKITFTDTGYTLAWAQTGVVLPTGTIMLLVTAIG